MRRLIILALLSSPIFAQRITVQDGGGGGFLAGVNSSGYLETILENTSIAVTNSGTFAVQNTAATPAGANTIGGVFGIGNAAFGTGQTSVIATATQLSSNASKQVCINALSTNVISVFIGASSVTDSTGFELKAGAGACLPLSNTNQVYVIASTTGATVTWLFTN